MTIRLRHAAHELDAQQLAAALTPSLLNPTTDDAPSATGPTKPGLDWVLWSEVLGSPRELVLD